MHNRPTRSRFEAPRRVRWLENLGYVFAAAGLTSAFALSLPVLTVALVLIGVACIWYAVPTDTFR